MKKIYPVLLVFTLFILPLSALAQTGRQTLCPVMPGTRVNEKYYVDYQGKRIFFCCKPCVKAFKKHPERYKKNLPKD